MKDYEGERYLNLSSDKDIKKQVFVCDYVKNIPVSITENVESITIIFTPKLTNQFVEISAFPNLTELTIKNKCESDLQVYQHVLSGVSQTLDRLSLEDNGRQGFSYITSN